MSIQAQEFWATQDLFNVGSLLNRLYDMAATDEEFSDMYDQDARDVEIAIELFRQDAPEALAQHIYQMDTSPREDLVVAFGKDVGRVFVRDVLGYEIR